MGERFSGRSLNSLWAPLRLKAVKSSAVYNSFPLNECPAELWSALDPQDIATEIGAAAAPAR
jgi:hypothetical protein